MISQYKQQHSFAERLADADLVRREFTDRVPVILEKAPKSGIPDLDQTKFLILSHLTVGQFCFLISRRLDLNHGDALFFFVNNVMVKSSSTMGSLYEEHHEDDQFLYIAYSDKNVLDTADVS